MLYNDLRRTYCPLIPPWYVTHKGFLAKKQHDRLKNGLTCSANLCSIKPINKLGADVKMTQDEFEKMRIKDLEVQGNMYHFEKMAIGDVLKVNTKETGKTIGQVIQAAKVYSAANMDIALETRVFGDYVAVRCYERGGLKALSPGSKGYLIYPFCQMNHGDVLRLNIKDYGKTHKQIVQAAYAYTNSVKAKREGKRLGVRVDGDHAIVKCFQPWIVEGEAFPTLEGIAIGGSVTLSKKDYGKSQKKMVHDVNKYAYKRNMRFRITRGKDEIIATRTH